MRTPTSAFVLTFAIAVAGCGGGSSSTPTAPSLVSGAGTVAPAPPGGGTASSGTATIRGTVTVPSTSRGASGVSAPSALVTITVQVVGTAVTAPVDAEGRFELRDAPPGDLRLRFTASTFDVTAPLDGVKPSEVITIVVSVSSQGASVVSDSRSGSPPPTSNTPPPTSTTPPTTPPPTNTQPPPAPTPPTPPTTTPPVSKVEIEGRIEARPANDRVVVDGKTVALTASTSIRKGGSSAQASDLVVGVRVHVVAQQAASGLEALSVEIQNTNTDIPVELNGTVSGLSGGASAFSFRVNGREVRGNPATEFIGDGNRGATFSSLKDGARVEVKGLQQDGYVQATRIHVEDDDSSTGATEVEAKGAVAGLAGTSTCPVLKFSVGPVNAVTNGSTEFKDVTCPALKNGDKVEIEGTRQADGSVLLKKVQRDK